MWLLGISHLQHITKFASGRWFRIGKVRSCGSFFAQKTFTFLWNFLSPQNFYQKYCSKCLTRQIVGTPKIKKRLQQMSYLPPNLWNVFFFPEILGGKTRMPASNPNGESGTQPRNPGKLLRSIATSAVPFADFQNDGVDGWMAWK